MSVAQAQQAVSAREYAEWVAYDALSPIGQERIEYYLVYLLWMTACINHSGKGQPPKITDFLMVQPERKPKTPEELEVIWRGFVAAHKNVQKGKRK